MSQHSSRSPSIYNEFAPKTCIIISNLHKNDFIIVDSNTPQLLSKKLSLVDQIKLSVLNINETPDFIEQISYWSSLPFLNRIIIIFRDESAASIAYKHLTQGATSLQGLYPYVKVALQENLLQRSKSTDNLDNDNLAVAKSLEKFKNFHNDPDNIYKNYSEPEPQQFNVLLDLPKLGIDLSDYNSEEQMEELKQDELQSRSLSPERPPALRRSSTKTLYKPSLHLNTESANKTHRASDFATSPTITLDETF
ncbi:uncharacterized protein SPAPADRAFT_63644 [Spathaspora passalidarum NRRL Y-27907]|uniref:Uncharacterized protein n=1 Tax=Spathaspora passalidarum (strain NRRL Y-27907 / 11-Y1) TaxID=619300 RepID=G3AUT5_SPAPN|nr:uncharacterized protein SPAPADRAFT_63644 [Spathaspora passalidarum NRRL Y-27907]EGW30026.1 hypothetical protein SPAPADRAFT_63644 [Spathaspora passalidarum NRRL Y-27907]